MIKAYLAIDDLSELEIPAFQELARQFFVEYSMINIIDGKRLYIGIIKDASEIESFLEAIKGKNPIIIGVFNIDGLQLGVSKVVIPAVFNEDGEVITEEVVEINGEPLYPFNGDLYLSLMPDEYTYDEDGNVLTASRPTEFKELKNFSGWSKCIF